VEAKTPTKGFVQHFASRFERNLGDLGKSVAKNYIVFNLYLYCGCLVYLGHH